MLNIADVPKVLWLRDFSAKGRACRSEYFGAVIPFIFLIYMIMPAVFRIAGAAGYFVYMVSIVIIVSVQIRRLHDRDMSGWFTLLYFIPLIGVLILLLISSFAGSRGDNRFGKEPLSSGYYEFILANCKSFGSAENASFFYK